MIKEGFQVSQHGEHALPSCDHADQPVHQVPGSVRALAVPLRHVFPRGRARATGIQEAPIVQIAHPVPLLAKSCNTAKLVSDQIKFCRLSLGPTTIVTGGLYACIAAYWAAAFVMFDASCPRRSVRMSSTQQEVNPLSGNLYT